MLESQNQEKIDKRNTMIVETAKLAEIEDFAPINNDEEAKAGIGKITDKVASLKKELSDLKSAADAEEKKMQAIIDTSRDALSKHEQKISSKESEIHKNKKEVIKLERAITDANESKIKLEVLEKKCESAEEEFKDAQNELNVEECQQEINDDEKAVETHENELVELDEKVN